MLTQLWLEKIKSSVLSLLPSNIYCVLDFYLCQNVAIKMDEPYISVHQAMIYRFKLNHFHSKYRRYKAYMCEIALPHDPSCTCRDLQTMQHGCEYATHHENILQDFLQTSNIHIWLSELPFPSILYRCIDMSESAGVISLFIHKQKTLFWNFFYPENSVSVDSQVWKESRSSYSEISHLNNTYKVKDGAWFFI